MKGEDRAQEPGPRSDFNRKDKPATCEQCGGPRSPRNKAFCSYECHRAWKREHPPERPEPPTTEQMIAEMHAALDALQALVEGETK